MPRCSCCGEQSEQTQEQRTYKGYHKRVRMPIEFHSFLDMPFSLPFFTFLHMRSGWPLNLGEVLAALSTEVPEAGHGHCLV